MLSHIEDLDQNRSQAENSKSGEKKRYLYECLIDRDLEI